MSSSTSLEGANSYRLRMVYNQWYLHLLKDGKYIGDLGPFDHATAEREAKKLGIADEDKKDVSAFQRS